MMMLVVQRFLAISGSGTLGTTMAHYRGMCAAVYGVIGHLATSVLNDLRVAVGAVELFWWMGFTCRTWGEDTLFADIKGGQWEMGVHLSDLGSNTFLTDIKDGTGRCLGTSWVW